MSGQDDISTNDELQIKLYGPDGKLKNVRKGKDKKRGSWKDTLFNLLKWGLAIILIIPYLMYQFYKKMSSKS